jgi:hypothetical protein
MVCFSAEEVGNAVDNALPPQLFCAGVHPGRVWDREYLRKQWTEVVDKTALPN